MSMFFCHLVEYTFDGSADGFSLYLSCFLMVMCVKCRSRGNTPAATSTASVPDVLGRPKQRHRASLCILASLEVYFLHCQTTAP